MEAKNLNNNSLTYFTDANTCCGYFSFLQQNFKNCRNKFFIKNAAFSLKDELFQKIIGFCEQNSFFYHRIIQPGHADKLCGIYIPSKDALAFCIPFYENYNVVLEAIDASKGISAQDIKKINRYTSDIEILKKNMYSHLSNAKTIHDDWEKIYISNMDFEKADAAAQDMISELFAENTHQKTAVNVDRFFGSMLVGGSVNYINSLTHGFEKRIFIKGRPGTGKSTFLKKIRTAALNRGFDTETYYCSFDPGSLDMVIIRELSVCIFDSTSPHEMFPSLSSDNIFDIYNIAVTAGTDEKYFKELSEIQVKYDIEMAEAKKHLSDILKIHDETNSIYEKYQTAESKNFIAQILNCIF